MLTNIYSAGLLSIDTGAAFYGSAVIVKANATLSSGKGGSYFGGSFLTLMPNSTFTAIIGSGSLPMQFMTCPTGAPSYYCNTPKTSNATVEGAILDIVSYQPLPLLQGSYTIITITAGSTLSGNFGLLQFNGLSLSLPYNIVYSPNSSYITSISVLFHTSAPTLSPTKLPSLMPSQKPSPAPSAMPTTEPSLEPSNEPSDMPSTAPSKPPSSLPSWSPTPAPSTENPVTENPLIEPSPFPTDLPSAIATFLSTLSPTMQRAILSNLTNSTLLFTGAPGTEPVTDAPLSPFAAPSSSPVASSAAGQDDSIIYWLTIGGAIAGGVIVLSITLCAFRKCYKNSSINQGSKLAASAALSSDSTNADIELDKNPFALVPQSHSSAYKSVSWSPSKIAEVEAAAFPPRTTVVWKEESVSNNQGYGERGEAGEGVSPSSISSGMEVGSISVGSIAPSKIRLKNAPDTAFDLHFSFRKPLTRVPDSRADGANAGHNSMPNTMAQIFKPDDGGSVYALKSLGDIEGSGIAHDGW